MFCVKIRKTRENVKCQKCCILSFSFSFCLLPFGRLSIFAAMCSSRSDIARGAVAKKNPKKFGAFQGVYRKIERCFEGALRVSYGSLKGVSKNFLGSFKNISEKFQSLY